MSASTLQNTSYNNLTIKFVTQLSEVSNSEAPSTPVTLCVPMTDMTRNCVCVGGVAGFIPPPVLVASSFHFATGFLAELFKSHHLCSICSVVQFTPEIFTEFTCNKNFRCDL